MRRAPWLGIALTCAALPSEAQSPFASRAPAPVKSLQSSAPKAGGGFAMGADDCASAHTNVGTGDVTSVPFTTGTTGSTGQNEPVCFFFGTTGIENDVWFDWTASLDGTATARTCASSLDTRLAVYPLSTCPADGTALACNDDACNLQSAVSWSCSAGTSYTIQLGTFPGAPGGSGTFDVVQTGPPPCGEKDDGSTENSLGLNAGGEIGWLTVWDVGPGTCFVQFDLVETAYGTLMFPGSVTNGASSRVAVYRDADMDTDPTTGLTLEREVDTVVVNGDTDILNAIPLGGCIVSPSVGHVWTLVTADHLGGQFPAPMDQTPPTHAAGAWVVGSTLGPGSLDLDDLSANDVAPANMASIGFACNWLSRLDDFCGEGSLGLPLCFGDGSGTPCPCGNDGFPFRGCANGTGDGAYLIADGSPSVTADTLGLIAYGVINDNGLFFQGDQAIAGGSGVTFGDGLRCCGQSVVRLEVVNPPGSASPATAQSTIQISSAGPPGTIQPGDGKCYQFWYRDPATSPCGGLFNLTNALSIFWYL